MDKAYKHHGWSGNMMAVLNYLRVVGADVEDPKANKPIYLIGGEKGIVSFMGMASENADVVIPAETVYYIKGKPAPLAAGLRSTSAGIGVYAITG